MASLYRYWSSVQAKWAEEALAEEIKKTERNIRKAESKMRVEEARKTAFAKAGRAPSVLHGPKMEAMRKSSVQQMGRKLEQLDQLSYAVKGARDILDTHPTMETAASVLNTPSVLSKAIHKNVRNIKEGLSTQQALQNSVEIELQDAFIATERPEDKAIRQVAQDAAEKTYINDIGDLLTITTSPPHPTNTHRSVSSSSSRTP